MNSNQSTHERVSAVQQIEGSSNRSFGVVFCVVFLIVGLWPSFWGGDPRVWSISIASVLLVITIIRPQLLALLNRCWIAFGLMLHKVMNPVVMGFLFFLVVTPIALIMRVLGKRPLELTFERDLPSYWKDRDPPGPQADTMKNQY